MNNIKEIIKEEKIKHQKLLDYYLKAKEGIPKGSIEIKKINDENYVYLKYREENRIVSKYYGKELDNLDLIEKIQRRKHAECMIKRLKEEIKNIERLEKYADISRKQY